MLYNKFLNNHFTVLSALIKLLCKDQPNVHGNAFQNAKTLLIDSPTLVHDDDSKPLYMTCDASAYGCVGVLFHRINGSDRPVAFASCTLTKSQWNYSQLDKGALRSSVPIWSFIPHHYWSIPSATTSRWSQTCSHYGYDWTLFMDSSFL